VSGRESIPSRSRFRPTHWIRLAITLALIVWIVRQVDWAEFTRTIKGTDLYYLALSLAVDPVLVLVSAWKWLILLRVHFDRPGLAGCFYLYLVGYFFNNFLPTNVGGDVVRAYLLGRGSGRQADAMASVFAERFTGITALVGLALLALPLGHDGPYAAPVGWIVGAVATAYLLVLWVILDRRFLRFTRKRTHLPLVGKIVGFQEALSSYGGHRGQVAVALALSLLFYGLAALNIYFSAKAFRADLGLLEAALVTPAVLVVALLPLTIGGLGLTEWAYLFTLGKFGISPAASLSTALLMRMKNVLEGLVGGVGQLVSALRTPSSS
jgi:uncharacterized protein (TIRG00374 family)